MNSLTLWRIPGHPNKMSCRGFWILLCTSLSRTLIIEHIIENNTYAGTEIQRILPYLCWPIQMLPRVNSKTPTFKWYWICPTKDFLGPYWIRLLSSLMVWFLKSDGTKNRMEDIYVQYFNAVF